MPVNWTNCPCCDGELKSRTFGDVGAELKARACLKCLIVCLVDDSKWFDATNYIVDELQARHELIQRASPEARWQEAFDSESDDPRWNL